MSFTLTDTEGRVVQKVYSCTSCLYISSQDHFINGTQCPLCYSNGIPYSTQKLDDGMSSFKYQQLKATLRDDVSGVGSATIDSIDTHFEDGDAFLDAVQRVYEEREFDALTSISGIGQSTAENIAMGIADLEGWEDGLLEQKFAFE